MQALTSVGAFSFAGKEDSLEKLTYTNSTNGLSMEFSSDSRTMHLDLRNFDGCSVGASAVTYKPVGLPGEKLITGTLNSRTIIVPVEFTATDGGKYSRTGALGLSVGTEKSG